MEQVKKNVRVKEELVNFLIEMVKGNLCMRDPVTKTVVLPVSLVILTKIVGTVLIEKVIVHITVTVS